MKILEEIISIIKDLKKEIEQKYKAEIMGIFGLSQEKNGKKTSDVDILVKFYENATLFDFIGNSIFCR